MLTETEITSDLMNKIADDITATMRRTLALAPGPMLPVAMSGGAAAIAFVAASLADIDGTFDPKKPDPEDVLLAGLLVARLGNGGDDPIKQAYEDYRILKEAGRAALKEQGDDG